MRSALATYSPLHARVYRGADARPPLMPSAALSRSRGAPSAGEHTRREKRWCVCVALTPPGYSAPSVQRLGTSRGRTQLSQSSSA